MGKRDWRGEVVTFEGMDIYYILFCIYYIIAVSLTCIDSKGVYSLNLKS
jgi:hypothetical protein